MDLPRRIPYNPKWWSVIACVAFFGVCSILMGYKATQNNTGMIINGIIRLGPTGATVFYWVISVLGAGFVFLGLMLAVRRVSNPQVLELGTDAMLLPHGRFQRQTLRIAYSDIQRVSEVKVSGQRFLYVISGGFTYTITASLFPDAGSYAEMRDFLASHTTHVAQN